MSLSVIDSASLRQIRWRLTTLTVETKFLQLKLAFKAGFNPSQPRKPAGHSDGGQWTDSGGTRVAQNAPRGPNPRNRSAGRWMDATPAQQARLSVTRAQADAAIQRVRERDPNWRPTPSAYETIEGEISANLSIVQEANARIIELQNAKIGSGSFAVESIPSNGPSRNFSKTVREEINRIGNKWGCHTCGNRNPGTYSGNFVPDHQLPNALNPPGRAQRLYPQCLICSKIQGSSVRQEKDNLK